MANVRTGKDAQQCLHVGAIEVSLAIRVWQIQRSRPEYHNPIPVLQVVVHEPPIGFTKAISEQGRWHLFSDNWIKDTRQTLLDAQQEWLSQARATLGNEALMTREGAEAAAANGNIRLNPYPVGLLLESAEMPIVDLDFFNTLYAMKWLRDQGKLAVTSRAWAEECGGSADLIEYLTAGLIDGVIQVTKTPGEAPLPLSRHALLSLASASYIHDNVLNTYAFRLTRSVAATLEAPTVLFYPVNNHDGNFMVTTQPQAVQPVGRAGAGFAATLQSVGDGMRAATNPNKANRFDATGHRLDASGRKQTIQRAVLDALDQCGIQNFSRLKAIVFLVHLPGHWTFVCADVRSGHVYYGDGFHYDVAMYGNYFQNVVKPVVNMVRTHLDLPPRTMRNARPLNEFPAQSQTSNNCGVLFLAALNEFLYNSINQPEGSLVEWCSFTFTEDLVKATPHARVKLMEGLISDWWLAQEEQVSLWKDDTPGLWNRLLSNTNQQSGTS